MQTVEDIEKRREGAKWYKDTDKEKKHPFFMVEDTNGVVHTKGRVEPVFSCGRVDFFDYVISPEEILAKGFCEDCYKLMEQEALKEARGQ